MKSVLEKSGHIRPDYAHVAKLVRPVAPGLRIELLDVERMPLQPGGRFSRAQAFVCEQLAVPNPADVRDE